LQEGDLTFRDYMELALYHPELGYYARRVNPVGKAGDYVTAPSLSPVFAFAIARLFHEFVGRQEGGVSTFVDIGCGDGGLVRAVSQQGREEGARFLGIDRALERAVDAEGGEVRFVRDLAAVPRDGAHLLFSNELFDAFPFARLVQRDEHLHELWVTDQDGTLDWSEHEAPAPFEDYFAERGVELEDGQFADITPEWELFYEDLARFVTRGLIVTIDYGFLQEKLFDRRIRRFGTAASYRQQRVSRDVLSNPGEQDLTAHINFSDLRRAGERNGFRTLFFDSLAKFLLGLGATEHELFRPVLDVEIEDANQGLSLLEARDEARRLILPDGIGEDLRVLVQEKSMGEQRWSFERKLF
jgi:SAM-dependent MidA family methyltransferase